MALRCQVEEMHQYIRRPNLSVFGDNLSPKESEDDGRREQGMWYAAGSSLRYNN